jgi:hypothetical protein
VLVIALNRSRRFAPSDGVILPRQANGFETTGELRRAFREPLAPDRSR